MLKYNIDIYKRILKPLNIKYFYSDEGGKISIPKNQPSTWKFLYPVSIRGKMIIELNDWFSSMDRGKFDRIPNGVSSDMKIALKGKNRYIKDMYEHLSEMIALNANILLYEETTGKIIQTGETVKDRLRILVAENEEKAKAHRKLFVENLSNKLRDMETEILSDKRFGEELQAHIRKKIEEDPIEVVGILCIFALFAECDPDKELFEDLAAQYCEGNKDVQQADRGTIMLPHDLTNTIVIGATPESVLFREREYGEIIEDICTKDRQSVVLSGMGGCGKTSVARLVYHALKDQFDCCGWINYTGDLKQSMISALKFDEYSDQTMTENDAKKKWNYIQNALSESKQTKLLVIDNVDYIEGIQSPTADKELIRIAGWKNMCVIVTSRLPELVGFKNIHKIENLGDSENFESCVGIFYHYNPKAKKYREDNCEIVKSLCELAGYNTMVIELLAKGSRYDYDDLGRFYQELKEVGFSYADEVPVKTDHDYNVLYVKDKDGSVQENYYDIGGETAATQLMKLFNLRTRKETERQILWDFCCLPESEKVSREEMTNWLGYSYKEVDGLVEEGWVQYSEGFFFVHPLVRSAVACTETDKALFWKKAEERRGKEKKPSLVTCVKNNTFFNEKDDFEKALRKIKFVNCLTCGGEFLAPETLIYIADFARKRGVREIGVSYYKMARVRLSDVADKIGCTITNHQIDQMSEEELKTAKDFWRSTYFYGYMLSYTKSGYDEAEECLAMACTVIRNISEHLPQEESMRLSAMSFDHYGYVKSNNSKSLLKNFVNACMLYRLAIEYRKELCRLYPDNLSYYKDLAWSYDNLGTLFAIVNYDELQGEKGDDSDLCLGGVGELFSYENEYKFFMSSEDKAEKYLKDALDMRAYIAEKKEEPNSTEVAWTCCNLATLLAKYPDRYEEAEKLLYDALDIYENLDKLYPGQHMSSTARTYTTYARLLVNWSGRTEDAKAAYKKALDINYSLEHDYPGVYNKEIENIKDEMKRKFLI